ncbi:MAG: aminotransferase class IV [Planctomycetota bacterium]|jgi:branched-chain amino acid aminotransferase|nr:aminotransferase class IV [Planctomycetota bacterium]
MAFALELYPVVYFAQYNPATQRWDEQWLENDRLPYAELQKLPAAEKEKILTARNAMPLPGISYTSQYGYGVFEGMKAFPNKNGGVTLFRPDRNAARFADSMRGIKSPVFPVEQYLRASVETVRRNAALGYVPAYRAEWEADNYGDGEAVYLRPFLNSEGAIGVGVAHRPSVVIGATTVSGYFKGGNTKAVTTEMVRAMPRGTGGLKCAANYVMSALAKREAEDAGFMEVVFLDGLERKFLQEGSSCNIFAYLKNGVLVTPALGDTILPGITRASVIAIAKSFGVQVEERPVTLAETLINAQEVFVTGTAAGVTPIESITHYGMEKVFNNRAAGALATRLQKELKGLQYGLLPDKFQWNLAV